MEKTPSAVVIGASAGGVDAIRLLTAALPPGFAPAVFIVLHIGAHRSELPWLLNQGGPLPASHPGDGDPIQPGHIYVAPPDHHLLVEPGVMRLTRGPRENWARPAVDPLFRSAAQAYGPGVIGVILTGGLNDGTAGLFEVKQHGGTTVVQDPDDAADPSMPCSALRHVAVDHCLPLSAIPALLAKLAGTLEAAAPAWRTDPAAPGTRKQAARGQETWKQETPKQGMPRQETSRQEAPKHGTPKHGTQGQEMTAEYKLDDPVALTCPDCGGALRRTELGSLTQFRCHIGHVYTADVMDAAQFAALEWNLGAAMRALSERGEMCRQMADKAGHAGDPGMAGQWDAAMREAKERTDVLRGLLEAAWTHPGPPQPPPPSGG